MDLRQTDPRYGLWPEVPRERYGRSLAGSVLVHAALLVFLIADFSGSPDWQDAQGAGGAGPAGGGGGGGAPEVQYLALPAFQRPAPRDQTQQAVPQEEVLVIPTAQIEQVEIVERFEIPRDQAPVDASWVLGRGSGEGGGAGAGPGSGGGIGSGRGTGIGSADGPGTGGGDGDIYPPTPRLTNLPLDEKPGSVRGKTYEVHFWVSATGEVLRVAINPEIRNGAFRARLVSRLHEWRFAPGVRRDGTPVPAEITVTITL